MFINNLKENHSRFYYCNKIVGKYLIRKGIPLLSISNRMMIFSKTKELQEVIDKMPLYIKIISKAGDKNEK